MALKLLRPYDNQVITWGLLASMLGLAIFGVISALGIAQPDPCLPEAQQQVGTALAMPLTYAEVAGSSFALLVYWLFIQNQMFAGQNLLRWILAVFTGEVLGMLGVWVVAFFAADCSRQAISNAAEFGVGPIFAFGNMFSTQYYNARVIEVTVWVILTTATLWAGRYLWLNIQR